MDKETLFKEMFMELARSHKLYCEGKCNISFAFMRLFLEEKGIKFSKAEKEEMI